MQIKVNFLENLKLEAQFDDFKVLTDQPIRYKGDGSAPGPFDYFLASSALCAAYFVKVYCNARDIETRDISLIQNNILDPENRYNQSFNIHVHMPDAISEQHKEGILKSVERCTVKRVVQNLPKFNIKVTSGDAIQTGLEYEPSNGRNSKTMIIGKDYSLEDTIKNMTQNLANLGINIEIASWRNLIPNVWSVHIRDADSPMCFSNGKGATKDAALCSALGEYLERISNNYFYNDFYLGESIANSEFVHYPDEIWFKPEGNNELPKKIMDEYLLKIYNPENELKANHLIDTNSGNIERGICAIPFIRQSDQKKSYIPVNLIGNLFVSNGMSAGNTITEARVQCLSEVFERAVKNKIISEEICLPDVPQEILNKYPKILAGIKKLEDQGFPILVKDASLGGEFPVICVTLMNPNNAGVFASFGAHPKFEVALERSLTELLQGRSFQGLNDVPSPTFNELAVTDHNNIVDHFIDSTGIVSWKFFSDKADYTFSNWNLDGDTTKEYEYLMAILANLGKEVYIADYESLGAKACRILVPDFSEIYLTEDLLWDNHNISIHFREDILNIHQLDDKKLLSLLDSFEKFEVNDYKLVSELIGIAVDEHSTWGFLNLLELKVMIYLVLKNYDEAKICIEELLSFNEFNKERAIYYKAISTILHINLTPDLNLVNFETNLEKTLGKSIYQNALKTISGEIRYYQLAKTNLELEDLHKHQDLIKSYQKLQLARQRSLS